MATIRLDPAAVRAELNRWGRRNTSDVADQVVAIARRNAPVETSYLRRSIRKVPAFSPRGPMWRVEATASYAPFVEEGTRPHQIRPKRAGGVLRFKVGGRVVYARIVNHPGTKATHFLSNAVREAAIRNGYNVRITG